MNPILALAQRLATGHLAPEDLPRELQSISGRDGIDGALLNDALGAVLAASPRAPVPLILATVQVMGAILTPAGKEAALGQVFLAAASHLDERLDDPAEIVPALTAAAHFYETARRFIPATEPPFGLAIMNEANTWQSLAGVGVEPEANLHKAIALYARARPCFPEGSHNAGCCQQNEAVAWQSLAELGIEPEANLRKAIALCAQASPCFPEGSLNEGECRGNEANAWQSLASVGIEPEKSCRNAIALYTLAAPCFPEGSPAAGRSWLNEANTWQRLAELGIEPEANLRRAINLYTQAAPCFLEGSLSAGACRLNEGDTWRRLAEVGIEPEATYRKAIVLYAQAAPCFPTSSPAAGRCRMNEASTWLRLAEMGIESEANLRRAINLCAQAAPCFPEDLADAGRCGINEANAWQSLADLGVEPEANYRKAIILYARAALCFPEASPNVGHCRMNEANTWQGLSLVGIEPEANLRKAINLYAQAAPCFPEGSPDTGRCWMNEVNTRLLLASVGVKPKANLRKAIALCIRAAFCFPESSPDVGNCWMGEANSWRSLADLGIRPDALYRKAIALYAKAAPCFPEGSPAAGRCRMNEATVWQSLAEVEGQDAGRCFAEAAQLHEAALPCFSRDTFDRAKEAHNFAGLLRAQAVQAASPIARADLLRRALTLLRGESGPILERIGGTFRNETERRGFRETFESRYRRIVTVCLELAALEENAEQAEALRWEAWQWVQRAKARTLQERLALFQTAAVDHDAALAAEFDAVLTEFSKLQDALRDERDARGGEAAPSAAPAEAAAIEKINAVLKRLLPPVGTEVAVPAMLEQEHFLAALARLGVPGRPVVVAEFFASEGEKFGVFLLRGGEAHGLREPVWLEGSRERATELARACIMATAILAKDPSRRSRDRAVKPEELSRDLSDNAKEALEAVAADLGAMLGPLREAIAARGWQDATLVLCPTGVLHLLPLAAAHWGAEADGTPCPLIAAHPLIHLPTAALAVEVARRERGLTAENRTAYVAAADRSNKLKAIHNEADDVKTKLEARGFAVRNFSEEAALAHTLWAHGPQAWIVHLAMHTGSHERFELCGVEFQDRRLLVIELLMWLRLRHAALAVVATCSSSQVHGFDLAADDPSALTRAWMLAGAQSVLGGLWPLDDSAAAEFSKVFYEEWAGRGAPLAEAVQTAILAVRETRGAEDVFAWAPFVLVGHGATVVT